MDNHSPQRKLRRSFGSQPVGCLVGARQPEAGVAVQVTQDHSSRWTFLSSDDGDLPTCRPADLPTCRIWLRMTTRVPALSTSSGPSSGGASTFTFKVERFAPCRASRAQQSFPGSTYYQGSPQISPLRIVFHSSSPSSCWMPQGTPSHQVVNSGRIKIK